MLRMLSCSSLPELSYLSYYVVSFSLTAMCLRAMITNFWYNFVFAILIIVFAYFYTAITINLTNVKV